MPEPRYSDPVRGEQAPGQSPGRLDSITMERKRDGTRWMHVYFNQLVWESRGGHLLCPAGSTTGPEYAKHKAALIENEPSWARRIRDSLRRREGEGRPPCPDDLKKLEECWWYQYKGVWALTFGYTLSYRFGVLGLGRRSEYSGMDYAEGLLSLPTMSHGSLTKGIGEASKLDDFAKRLLKTGGRKAIAAAKPVAAAVADVAKASKSSLQKAAKKVASTAGKQAVSADSETTTVRSEDVAEATAPEGVTPSSYLFDLAKLITSIVTGAPESVDFAPGMLHYPRHTHGWHLWMCSVTGPLVTPTSGPSVKRLKLVNCMEYASPPKPVAMATPEECRSLRKGEFPPSLAPQPNPDTHSFPCGGAYGGRLLPWGLKMPKFIPGG